MTPAQVKNIYPLSDNQCELILSLGFEIGQGYKTHSSTFYHLTKHNKNYLLKIDQTNSGSLIHQYLYSQNQANLGLPHIQCEYLSEDNDILIMEKIENAVMLKGVSNNQLLKERGRQMRKVHDIGVSVCKLWEAEYGEFIAVGKRGSIEEFLNKAEDRVNKLTLEDEQLVRAIIEFIRKDTNKLDNSISFLHGDPHLNNVIFDKNKLVVIDPSGTVLHGSRYIDLAIVAIDYPGYFDKKLENTSADFDFFTSFLEGYGQIDIEQLHYFICLRGSERFAFSNIIPNINLLTKYIFAKLS